MDLKRFNLLAISHDASRTGAPKVLYHLLKWLNNNENFNIKTFFLSNGPLFDQFSSLNESFVDSHDTLSKDVIHKLSPDLVLLNTVKSGKHIKLIRELNIPIITWVHERYESIKTNGWCNILNQVGAYSDLIIAAGKAVKTDIEMHCSKLNCNVVSAVEFIEEYHVINKQLSETNNIWCCGNFFYRKGFDIASLVAIELNNTIYKIRWIGGQNRHEVEKKRSEARSLNSPIILEGIKNIPHELYQPGDVFLCPSREDPFPLVAIEALACGLPVICYSKAGSLHEFIFQHECGIVVDILDPKLIALSCEKLLKDKNLYDKLSKNALNCYHKYLTVNVNGPVFANYFKNIINNHEKISL